MSRGGSRLGAGRPQGERTETIHVRISEESKIILDKQENKSEFIDKLIKSSEK